MSHDQPMQDHEYDGIQELDNALPAWWLITFLGTIIFAFIYWIHYEFGGGLSPAQQLTQDLARLESQREAGKPAMSEETLQALFNEGAIEEGRSLYLTRCAACHGPDGGGLIGPNLTDNSWINGRGTRLDIYQIIAEGVPAKGMPPWEGQMSPDDLVRVAAFVHSLKGTFVTGGKPPQGEEYP